MIRFRISSRGRESFGGIGLSFRVASVPPTTSDPEAAPNSAAFADYSVKPCRRRSRLCGPIASWPDSKRCLASRLHTQGYMPRLPLGRVEPLEVRRLFAVMPLPILTVERGSLAGVVHL